MKRFLATFLLFLPFLPAFTMAQEGEPKFLDTFKPIERVHDFGTIMEQDGKVEHTFVLENKGRTPVAISDVNTWCGCMVASYTKSGVRRGEKAKVRVTLDPSHKQGNFVKQVVLLLNGGKNYVRLWVKANIVPSSHPVQENHPYHFGNGLWMSQKLLPFPNLKAGQQHSFILNIANDTNQPMSIVFKRNPNNTVLKMPTSIQLKAKERKSIKVSYRYHRQYNYTRYILVTPIVNGKKCEPLKIQWNGSQKFRLGPG